MARYDDPKDWIENINQIVNIIKKNVLIKEVNSNYLRWKVYSAVLDQDISPAIILKPLDVNNPFTRKEIKNFDKLLDLYYDSTFTKSWILLVDFVE